MLTYQLELVRVHTNTCIHILASCRVLYSGVTVAERVTRKPDLLYILNISLKTLMSESLRYLGTLDGHKGWVTAIATSSENPDMIVTASRGELI